MKANDLFPLRHRATLRNWIRCLTIAFCVAILQDLQAQTHIVWHSFSAGFQRGSELSIAAVVGQPFLGIQSSGDVVVTSGFAAFEGIDGIVSDVHGKDDFIPATFDLSQNFPNPFNPSTVIRYELPTEVRMVIEIYSLLGQRIAILVDDVVAPGRYSVTWTGRSDDGRLIPSGVYFYRMRTPEFVEVKKLVLLK